MNSKLKESLKRYEYKRKMENYALERGYIPFHPQLFEEYESFSDRNPRIPRDELFVVLTVKQQILLLRPDITSALMKEIYPIAIQQERCKVFYQSTVYRNSKDGVKEINQFGIENIGVINEKSEIELIVMAIDLLSNVPFILEISHTGFLNGLIRECNISKEKEILLKNLVHQKNNDELEILLSTLNLSSRVKVVFNKLFELQGSGEELKILLDECVLNKEMEGAAKKILKIQEISPNIYVDLSIIGELDYYDGIVFKGYYDKLNKEVLSGGRYNLLTEDSEKSFDAIGFSIDTNAWISCQERDNI